VTRKLAGMEERRMNPRDKVRVEGQSIGSRRRELRPTDI
jgi:hypothetical protein